MVEPLNRLRIRDPLALAGPARLKLNHSPPPDRPSPVGDVRRSPFGDLAHFAVLFFSIFCRILRWLIETIHGDLKGLKTNQLKQLKRLYHQRVPGDRFTTPEFAQRLAAISTELEKPLCVYVNRRGQVIRVGVGTPRQTQIPPLELPRYGAERLCGIRCMATAPESDQPGTGALTALALQRLDALVWLPLTGSGFARRGGGVGGYVKSARVAHLLPPSNLPGLVVRGTESPAESVTQSTTVLPPVPIDDLAEQDFLDFVTGLEAEFAREVSGLEIDQAGDRVLLVGVQTSDRDPRAFEDGLAELDRLVDTAGGSVVGVVRQKRSRPHPQTVVGEGKVEEIALQAQSLGANLVAFDRDLSPAQIRNLEKFIGTRVVDRTEVILDIFAQRARSGAGKLQVELAQLEYLMPRLTGRGQAMSRLGGGIGTRGPGETKLETERRVIQRRISRLQREVNELQAHRNRLRQRRQHHDVPTVAIVGYTNAGKSTLLNVLTDAEVYAADQLFATLDPTTRRLTLTPPAPIAPIAESEFPDSPEFAEPTEGRSILLTDTVGFIQELPPPLMDAFRATLEEVTEAEALLHLVDLSHPSWPRHIAAVHEILGEMPIVPGPELLVFNKIDAASSEAIEQAKAECPHGVFISAGDRLGLETLRQQLLNLVRYATGE
ncbi:MAG: GTPase HflX [Limnothrix sp. BL-A-16]